ncbi:MAG: hypothetical protein M3546_17050 [Actinomycetota bacterium]|nr:hypothetical protein [Actinomycetota bacterium]
MLYVGWTAVARQQGHVAYDNAFIGEVFLNKGAAASPAIEANAPYANEGTGYDGQFFLFIAQDPANAHHYLDDARYRYGRILYPMVARAAAEILHIGIPGALVGINIVAVTLGVLALALLLRRRGYSPWLALLFGLYPGVFVSVLRDLSDVLAYALVAWAILVFDRGRGWGVAASAGLFALAILTRETTAIFAVIWAVVLLFQARPARNWRRAVAFTVAALAPYFAYRVFLLFWLGEGGLPAQLRPSVVPFGGILDYWPWDAADIQQLYAVVFPGTVCLCLALWALKNRLFDPAVAALAVNALLYVVLLPPATFVDFYSSLRIPIGVVTALVLVAPAFDKLFGRGRTWLLLPAIAWFAPWWQLLPIALQETW